MSNASIKSLYDSKLYVDYEVTLHGWVLRVDYRISKDVIGWNEFLQVLHMVRIQDGRKVFYKTTLLTEKSGIVTVMLKGSDIRSFHQAHGGSPYNRPYMKFAAYEIGDIVQYNEQNWKIVRAWMEGWIQGVFYDLVSVDPMYDDRAYDVPESALNSASPFYGLNAA